MGDTECDMASCPECILVYECDLTRAVNHMSVGDIDINLDADEVGGLFLQDESTARYTAELWVGKYHHIHHHPRTLYEN
jgi:hypothetical protein